MLAEYLARALHHAALQLAFDDGVIDDDAAIVGKANAEINRVLKSPALAQRFAAVGLEPAGNTSEAFAKTIRSEIVKWRKVVQAAKIRVE